MYLLIEQLQIKLTNRECPHLTPYPMSAPTEAPAATGSSLGFSDPHPCFPRPWLHPTT